MLVKTEKREFGKVKKLYKSAFPPAERKPFFMIRRKIKTGLMTAYSIVTAGEFSGILITAQKDDLVLLNYLAILPTIRGGGIGSKALADLSVKLPGKGIFLEIEEVSQSASNYGERQRRKHFYLKNGFTETGVSADLYGVRMEVLSNGILITPEEYENFYKSVFGSKIAKHIRAWRQE